jgi:hypothetical protein
VIALADHLAVTRFAVVGPASPLAWSLLRDKLCSLLSPALRPRFKCLCLSRHRHRTAMYVVTGRAGDAVLIHDALFGWISDFPAGNLLIDSPLKRRCERCGRRITASIASREGVFV